MIHFSCGDFDSRGGPIPRIGSSCVVPAVMQANHTLHDRGEIVMAEALDRQLQAYWRLRPKILAENNLGWALIVDEELIRIFPEFDQAAMYAETHFPKEQVLIRHTAEQRGTVPFIISGQRSRK